MRVLFYWQDIWLPHSHFIVEELQRVRVGCEIVVAGPARRANAAAIFTVHGSRQSSALKEASDRTDSYRWRETVCTLSEWRRLIRRYQPDIVIVADEAMSMNVLLASVANRVYGNGIVLFYAFENIVQGAGWRGFLERPSVGKLKSCLLKSLRVLLLDRLLMPVRRRLVSGGLVSYEECAEVVRTHGWSPRMAQQWWPVDSRVFVPDGPRAEFGLSASFVVGFVGRFVSEKGVGCLLDAVAELDERFGVVLIGDGPQKAALERRIADLGLGRRARILPPQDVETLAKSYRALNLLVLPSISTQTWKEQFGRVLMEARSCGTEIAGSDSGSIPFVVADPEMIFPEGDVSAMAQIIGRAADRRPVKRGASETVGPQVFVRAWLSLANDCLGIGRQGV